MNKSKKYLEREAEFLEVARAHSVDTDIHVACQGRLERDVIAPLANWISAEHQRGTKQATIVERLLFLVTNIVGVSVGRVDPDQREEFKAVVIEIGVDQAFEAAAKYEAFLKDKRDAGSK